VPDEQGSAVTQCGDDEETQQLILPRRARHDAEVGVAGQLVVDDPRLLMGPR
jgi:hypothetical protein